MGLLILSMTDDRIGFNLFDDVILPQSVWTAASPLRNRPALQGFRIQLQEFLTVLGIIYYRVIFPTSKKRCRGVLTGVC